MIQAKFKTINKKENFKSRCYFIITTTFFIYKNMKNKCYNFIKTYLNSLIIIYSVSVLLFVIQKSFNIHVDTSMEAFDCINFINFFFDNIINFKNIDFSLFIYIGFRNIFSVFFFLFGVLVLKKHYKKYIGKELSKGIYGIHLFSSFYILTYILGSIILIYYKIMSKYFINIHESNIATLKRFFSTQLMYAPIELLSVFVVAFYLYYIPGMLILKKYKKYGEVSADFALKLVNKYIRSFFNILKYVIVIIFIAAYLETQVTTSLITVINKTPSVWNMTQGIFYYCQGIHDPYIYKPVAQKERWIYLTLHGKKAELIKKYIKGIDECKEKLRGYLANNQLDYEKLNSIVKTILSRPDFFPIFNEIAKDVIDYSKRNNIMISSEDISKLEKELIKFNKYSVALEKDPKYLKYKTSVVTDEIKTVVIDRGINFSLMKCFIQ